MEIPEFKTKKELFDFLVENKETIISARKDTIKYADGIPHITITHNTTNKAASNDSNYLQVKAIINTTNIMDSHKDVHLPGIWAKSIQENRMIKHLQEHVMSFDKIISDKNDLKVSTKTYTWKELGFDWVGKTEALVFDSNVKKDRNTYMFNQYKQGNVDNHSVGMRYVKIILAINDEDYGAEKEAWDKYYPEIINKEEADNSGYFWAVKEAKVIEGSAVPMGSNFATPTLEVKEPSKDTQHKEPSKDTQKKTIILNYLLNQ